MAQGNRRPGRHSRQQSRVASLINGNGKQQHDSSPKATDEATVSYIKRTLCKKHSASVSILTRTQSMKATSSSYLGKIAKNVDNQVVSY